MNQQFSPADVNQTKSLAWMSYLGVLFFVPLLVYQQSPYTKFHVNQGLVLFIVEVGSGILQRVFYFIPLVAVSPALLKILLSGKQQASAFPLFLTQLSLISLHPTGPSGIFSLIRA